MGIRFKYLLNLNYVHMPTHCKQNSFVKPPVKDGKHVYRKGQSITTSTAHTRANTACFSANGNESATNKRHRQQVDTTTASTIVKSNYAHA